MIMHTVERASRARLVSRVIVATDDERVAAAVLSLGGEARLTSITAASGTDRVAEVAALLDFDIIVNVQGDEPLIDPSTIDAAIEPLIEDPGIHMSTTSEPITSVDDVFNPGVVKVVTDSRGFALFFSRSPIPHIRPASLLTLEESLRADERLLSNYRKHSGLYAYRREALRALLDSVPIETLARLSEGLDGLETTALESLKSGQSTARSA